MRRYGIEPPRVKFELHAYGEVHDITDSVRNWKELELLMDRDDTSGLFVEISFPFEFMLDAYDIVKDIFDKHKHRSEGDVYLYLLKDDWVDLPHEEQYYEPQVFNLDWVDYDRRDDVIEITSKKSNLYDFLKAKNRVTYDIPVDELKEQKKWNFERIKLENRINFLTANNTELDKSSVGSTAIYHSMVGISNQGSEVSVKDRVFTKTIGDLIDYREDLHFLEIAALPPSERVTLQIRIESQAINIVDALVSLESCYMVLTKNYDPNNPLENAISYRQYQPLVTEPNKYPLYWSEDLELELSSNDKLYLVIVSEYKKLQGGLPIMPIRTDIKTEGTLKIMYSATNQRADVDVIDPKVLLQALVDKMTGSKGIYTSEIEDFNTDAQDLIMLSAAESIRGIATKRNNDNEVLSQAQVHTSYRQFVEWMKTLGYDQQVSGNKLTLRQREKGFDGTKLIMELYEHECADLREQVNGSYLYSGLQIGYKRKDIENMNVRYEFNGEHNYGTDLNMQENILKLISPYRADCYGIEFLCQERGLESKDDKADKDLFLINVKQGDEQYETIYSHYGGNYPNDTLFNGRLNPYNLMLKNLSLLGISTKQLTFAASDSNASIVIDGKPMNADYTIPDDVGLFEPIVYDIASRNMQRLPTEQEANGIVRIHYKGEIFEGYILKITKSLAWETETVWVLYKKK